jgi:hypothetical protein
MNPRNRLVNHPFSPAMYMTHDWLVKWSYPATPINFLSESQLPTAINLAVGTSFNRLHSHSRRSSWLAHST